MQGKSIRLPDRGGFLQLLLEFLPGRNRTLDVLRHELRTPLTGILGMAELLRQSGLNGEQLQLLDALEQAGHQLTGLLQRAEAAPERRTADRRITDVQPRRMTFNGLHLLEGIARMHSVAARHRGLGLYLLFDYRLPLMWYSDEGLVRQALDNLLANAIKFTQSGHVLLEARGRREHGLVLTITDTGPGIAPCDAQAIYEFGRLGRIGNTAPCSGSGFGLFVCRRIAENLGGTLTHAATRHGGTSFILRLPGVVSSVPTGPERLYPRLLAGSVCEVSLPSPLNRVVAHALRRMGVVVRFRERDGAAEAADVQNDVTFRITGNPPRCEAAGLALELPQPILPANLEPLMLRLALLRRMQDQ